MLNQLAGVPLSAGAGLASEIHQVVRVVVTVTHHGMFGMMQEGEELVEEALPGLGRKLIV